MHIGLLISLYMYMHGTYIINNCVCIHAKKSETEINICIHINNPSYLGYRVQIQYNQLFIFKFISLKFILMFDN